MRVKLKIFVSAVYLPYIERELNSGCIYIGEVNSGHDFFNFNLTYPIFDVESIGDGPRGPRAHLKDLDFGFT